jgi:hypothetical protein
VIPPNSTLTLTVNNPTCAFQADAFYGNILTSFAGGVRYGRRDLDDVQGNGTNYCTSGCVTPQPTCQPTAIPTRQATPAFTPAQGCSSTPSSGVLSAVITDHPNTTDALFTNHSNTCSYPIGLAVYKKVDGNIDHQILYDYTLAVIPPHSTMLLTVNNPSCAYQGDAFYGSLIESFAGGQRYGTRRLDDTDGNGTNYCSTACPTPPAIKPGTGPRPGIGTGGGDSTH